MELGPRPAQRRQTGPLRPRRHRQRCRADDRHQRLPRPAARARRAPRPPRRTVRTMVPVSVRLPGERGVYNNRVSAVFARLPVGIEDPAERLAVIRAEMDEIKSSGQAVAGDVLAQLSGFAPPLLLALGSRAMTRSARLNMDTATTNVPGPAAPGPRAGPPAARVLSVRADRGHDPDRGGDLLLRRRAVLRGDRRPRPCRGHRRAHLRNRGRARRSARGRGGVAAGRDVARSRARDRGVAGSRGTCVTAQSHTSRTVLSGVHVGTRSHGRRRRRPVDCWGTAAPVGRRSRDL